MTKGQKKTRNRILISGVLFIAGMLIQKAELLSGRWLIFAFLPAYILIGYDVILSAIQGIRNRQIFDENFLMTIASLGAFAIGEYPEAVVVIMFYQVGELFQSYAVGKSRESISELMDIRPDYANIEKDGQIVQVDPEEIAVGDLIIVTEGEKIPLDGTVISGSSSVDTSALTGESVPRTLREGDPVISGCINLTGVLRIEVTKTFGEGTVAQILDLVENASSKKAKTENFITRFAQYYTPAVVVAAILLAVIPPLVIPGAVFKDWIYRALTFLVISCPCALVISVPLSFFGGIGGASRQGILVKGSNYLEALADTKVVVFDKTGTLTQGVFQVVENNPSGNITEEELLEITALAESYSNHPISASLKEAYGKEIDNSRIEDFQSHSGYGISAMVDGRKVFAGNRKHLEYEGIDFAESNTVGTLVYVARDGEYLGHIVIADRIKEESKQVIAKLHNLGISSVMLTGDSKAVADDVAGKIGLDKVYAELLPGDKVEKLEEILAAQTGKDKVAFVGDGVNDAPALTRSDIGIAMGALGSDAAIEAADVVLMQDKISKIPTAMAISKKTLRIVKQNIIFALGVKFLALALGALGLATMWQAVFADVGVSVIAILNAMRALNVKDIE